MMADSPKPESKTVSPLARSVNEFAFDLFIRLSHGSSSDEDGNVFLSPISISTAMSILLLGAKDDSEQQILTGLKLEGLTENVHEYYKKLITDRISNESTLTLVSYLLVQKEEANQTLDDFKKKASDYYSAEIDDVDFTTDGKMIALKANGWVNEKTKGLIKSVLDVPPDQSTKLIILNAIHFKGKWKEPFDRELTRKMAFYNNGKDKDVDTDFLISYGTRVPYVKGTVCKESVQIVKLFYEKENISMIVVLPDERSGLTRILTGTTFRQELTDLMEKLEDNPFGTKLNLFLPKFELQTDYTLNTVLTYMGMVNIFSQEANLSGINGRRDLSVSLVKHKAVVKVDEEGTEAAAVTAVVAECYCLKMSLDFIADRPFIFLIMRGDMIAFTGTVQTLP